MLDRKRLAKGMNAFGQIARAVDVCLQIQTGIKQELKDLDDAATATPAPEAGEQTSTEPTPLR